MAPDFDPVATLESIRSLKRAVIDSSSIIYSIKCGLLDRLVGELRLVSVRGVSREVGSDVAGIEWVESPVGTVDAAVLALASSRKLAVISEDREILFRAAEVGLDTFNILIMLELLLLRGVVDLVEWDRTRKRLLAAAHYHPRIVHAGNELHWAVRKEVG